VSARRGRRALIWLAVAAAVGWLWWHGHRRGDALVLMGPAGQVSGVISFEGELLFGVSNIRLGGRRAWTAQTLSLSRDEAVSVRERLLDTNAVARRAGFTAATHAKDLMGVPEGSCRLIGVPVWLVLGLCALPAVSWARWRWAIRRRRRRGWCLNCGYDLRGGGGVCPECGVGEALAAEAASPSAAGRQ
jgi:hypothetical protein